MHRKVLPATLAVVFIVSLCLFVYDQTHAVTITCSASASAGSVNASSSVSPSATGVHCNSEPDCNSKAGYHSGSGTAKASVNGDTDTTSKVISVHLRSESHAKTHKVYGKLVFSAGESINVPGEIISTTTLAGGSIEVGYEYYETRTVWGLRVETKSVSESNWGMPGSHKWASANGSCGGASDSAWAEYHSSSYYN